MNNNLVLNDQTLPAIRVGSDDFKKLLLNSNIFVDKSLLIKEVIEDSSDVILITRPRRWGKSLNMDMLRRFLEIEVDEQGDLLPLEQKANNKLFIGGEVDLGLVTGRRRLLKPLKIAEYPNVIGEYQGQFPVIFITFKNVEGEECQDIEQGIRTQLRNLFEAHSYLSNSSKLNQREKALVDLYLSEEINTNNIKNSLSTLAKLLYKHYNRKVWILIDEYDTPINSAYKYFGNNAKEFQKVLDLFRGMMKGVFKKETGAPELPIERGVITGILRIAKAELFSGLNNVREYTLLDKKFAKYYGFTQEEVDEMLKKMPTLTEQEKIKDWYNGYTFCGEVIYNPWSIMQCLASEGELDHYWLDSGGTGLIDKILVNDEMQGNLQQLAAGKSITTPITKQIIFDDINKPIGLFSLLLFSGYLNATPVEPEENIYALSVPNKEVRYIYERRVLEWVTNKLNIDSSLYYSFVSLLPAGKIEEFKERLQELLQNSTSFYQTGEKKAELFYSGFMLGLINMLTPGFIIESESESGAGRADIIMIPKQGKGERAIIIEYKVTKKEADLTHLAKIGLNQIINKQYDIKIRQYQNVKQIIKISIAFCGKNMDLQYQISEA